MIHKTKLDEYENFFQQLLLNPKTDRYSVVNRENTRLRLRRIHTPKQEIRSDKSGITVRLENDSIYINYILAFSEEVIRTVF